MEISNLIFAIVVALNVLSFIAFYFYEKGHRNEVAFLKMLSIGLTQQCIAHTEIRDTLKKVLKEEIQMARFGGYAELGADDSKARGLFLLKLYEVRSIVLGTHHLATAGGQSPKSKIVDLAQYKSNNSQKKDDSRQK